MTNPNAAYNAIIAAVIQASPPASGSVEEKVADVAADAKRNLLDLSSLRYPHTLPSDVVANLTRDATLENGVLRAAQLVPAHLQKQLALSVVDLSASKASPRYGGFNDRANFDSASVGKICGLLAAYQYAADVNQVLADKPAIADTTALSLELEQRFSALGLASPRPRLDQLLVFHGGPRPHVALRPELIARVDDISEGNENGSTPVVLLGYPFIASVMLAYRLFEPAGPRGLWLRRAWGPINYPQASDAAESLPDWKETPYPHLPGHSVTARSAALYFTLAAQGKLIDTDASSRILGHLDFGRGGCVQDPIDVTTLSAHGVIAAKCGYYEGRSLLALYYKAYSSTREFVVCVFTIGGAETHIKSVFDALVRLV